MCLILGLVEKVKKKYHADVKKYCHLNKSDSNQGSDYISIYLFFRTTFESLTCAIDGQLIFLPN